VQIVNFKPEHGVCLGDAEGKHAALAERGVAYTLMNGRPIFSCGAVVLWDGMAEAWFLTGTEAAKHPVSVVKTTMFLIADTIGKLKLHRLQATIDAENETAVRFAEALAFKREGLMQKFSPDGKDYYLYARVI